MNSIHNPTKTTEVDAVKGHRPPIFQETLKPFYNRLYKEHRTYHSPSPSSQAATSASGADEEKRLLSSQAAEPAADLRLSALPPKRTADMPVIAAARFECHVIYRYLLLRDGRYAALPDEILCKRIVRHAYGEENAFPVLFRPGQRGGHFAPHILCKAEHRPCLRPADIHSGVGYHRGDFLACDPVCLCVLQVICQRGIGNAGGHQCDNSYNTFCFCIRCGIVPYLAEEYIKTLDSFILIASVLKSQTGCFWTNTLFISSSFSRCCDTLSAMAVVARRIPASDRPSQ